MIYSSYSVQKTTHIQQHTGQYMTGECVIYKRKAAKLRWKGSNSNSALGM